MSRERSGAFTLVELLVVVAIIALLIAILLPALGRARDVAKMTVCMSTMKQIMLGNITYASEQEGWYVPAYDNTRRGGGGHEPGEKWASNPLFRKVLGVNPAAVEGFPPVDDDGRWLPDSFPGGLICPDAAYAREGEYASNRLPPDGMFDTGRSWVINVFNKNEWIGGHWTASYAGTRQSFVDSPSGNIAFIENFNGSDLNYHSGNDTQVATENGVSYYVGEFDTHTMGLGWRATPSFRHPGDSMNAGFFDGHAAGMQRGECVNLDDPGGDNDRIENLWHTGTKDFSW